MDDSDSRRCPAGPAMCKHCGQIHHEYRGPLVRPRILGLLCAVGVILVLAALASGLADYWRNFAQNIAADLTGAAISLYAIAPLARQRNRHCAAHLRPDLRPKQKAVDQGDSDAGS